MPDTPPQGGKETPGLEHRASWYYSDRAYGSSSISKTKAHALDKAAAPMSNFRTVSAARTLLPLLASAVYSPRAPAARLLDASDVATVPRLPELDVSVTAMLRVDAEDATLDTAACAVALTSLKVHRYGTAR